MHNLHARAMGTFLSRLTVLTRTVARANIKISQTATGMFVLFFFLEII